MTRKIIAFVCLVLLTSCQQGIQSPTDLPDLLGKRETTTAMLLPLSGRNAAVGEDFKNAALLAQMDRGDDSTTVLFFDTAAKGGVSAAYDQAMEQNADIILGPIFSADVAQIANEDPTVPVVSFTSDTSVLESGIYSMGLLIPSQIQRNVDFMCANGQYKIGVIGPDNKTCKLVMDALEKAIETCPGMTIYKTSLYTPGTVDLGPAVLKIVPETENVRNKEGRSKSLVEEVTERELPFDALLVFESGVKLQQLASMLAYYDAGPNIVPTYSLTTIKNTRDINLTGIYFPDLPQSNLREFKLRYADLFGKKPLDVASFSYDATGFSSLLGSTGRLNDTGLLNPDGFNGVNGRFRLRADGTNERLLSVFQIRAPGAYREVEGPAGQFGF